MKKSLNQNKNTQIKAVVFARVSSREQEMGASIDAQLDTVRQYCQRNSLPILKEYAITESSTRGERAKYNEMLNFIKGYNGKVALVVNCVDRLQRSFKDSPELDGLRDSGKLEIHFIKEGLVLNQNSGGSNIMSWNLSVMMANSYVLSLIDNVKRSQKYIWECGRWQSKAPIGYLNTRNNNSQGGRRGADVILDPDRAPKIRMLFEEYALGQRSLNGMVDFARQIGLTQSNGRPVKKPQMNTILHNPFYFGKMVIKDKEYHHTHGAIITEELFDIVQDILSGRQRVPNKRAYGTKEFALRGLVRCSCGCLMSPEIKKGKYVYLKCSHARGKCEMAPIKESAIIDPIIEQVFDNLALPDELVDELKDAIKENLRQENAHIIQAKRVLAQKLTLENNKKDRMLDLLIDGTLTREMYDAKMQDVDQTIKQITKEMEQYVSVDTNATETAEMLLDVVANAGKWFKSYKPAQQNEILGILLYNCRWDGKNPEFSLQKPFDGLVKTQDCLLWLGQLDSNQY